MPSPNEFKAETSDKKINLILILQAHPSEDSDDLKIEIVYSQFKIMQILSSYTEFPIVSEGAPQGLGSKDRVSNDSLIFLQEVFPQKGFNQLTFESLTLTQKSLLNKMEGSHLLFQLGLIPCIYQGISSTGDEKILRVEYRQSYSRCLESFPILCTKKDKNGIQLKDLNSPSEVQAHEEFALKVRHENPNIFENRERAALQSVIMAANESGKNQVVLIFGKHHARGIFELINNSYKDKIHLELCIDSTEGFCKPNNQQSLDLNKIQTLTSPHYGNATNRQCLMSFFKANGYGFVYEGDVLQGMLRNTSHFG